WIGKVGQALFVYDPEIQSGEEDTVTLFSYSFDQPVKLNKNSVKQQIRKALVGDRGIEEVLNRYRNWKDFYSSELKRINSEAVPDAAKFLRSVQNGVIKAYWGRKARCYGCGTSLSGKRGNICHECLWIVCSCGACGCGWHTGNKVY
ncbi:MAG: hypothetical protein MN733_09045, partial [Nitrososphaera sp.]|nr:hypothetical protein [Nitrososphaera sp.]